MVMKNFSLPIICCAIAVSISSCSSESADSKNSDSLAPARPNAVAALGRVQPQGEVIKLSIPNAQDSRVDRILIKEGDFVKSNQVIASLQGIDRKQADLRDALADVKLREVELRRATNNDVKSSQLIAQTAVITRLQAQLASSRKQRQAALVSARSRLRNAEADYQRQVESQRQGLGLLTATAKLANAKAEYLRRSQFDRSGDHTLGTKAKLANATAEYVRKQEIYKSGGVSKSQLDKATEEYTSAKASVRERELETKNQLDKAGEELAAAKANLQEKKLEVKSQLGKFSTELLLARETVKEKQAELEQSDRTVSAEIQQERAKLAELREVRPTDIQIAQAQLEKAKIAVEQKQAALRDSEVRVPVDGQILKINTRVGEQVNTTQGIVELAQTNNMYVVAEVSEIDVSKIRQGQSAAITSENNSFTGELKGTVEHIGLQVGRKQAQEAGGGNPASDKEARIVMIKIKISPSDSSKVAKLTNMQVRVKIPIN
jgi:HlyD family secretion protein